MLSKLILWTMWTLVVSIDGPTTVEVGEVLTLTSSSTDAVRTKWLVPAAIKFINVANKLHVVAEKAGTYTITFIGVDKQYNIEATTHTFKVEQKDESDSVSGVSSPGGDTAG